MTDKLKRYSIRLPLELVNGLKEINKAKHLDLSFNSQVQIAIEQYIKAYKQEG